MKKLRLAGLLLCLLLLAGCGQSVIWAEVGTSVFDLEKAAEENLEVPVFDSSVFRFDLDETVLRPLTWLDEESVLCLRTNGTGRTDMVAVTLDGEETLLQEGVDPAILAVSAGTSVAYAAVGETLEQGVSFAKWNSKDQTLDPVYDFTENGAPGFARCFNPSGTKAALAWNKVVPSKDWTVRVVDMKKGKTRDLIPPVWDTQSAYIVLFIHWLNDETLQVIAREGSGARARFAAWECKP